ncbi:PilZ domain-containing protein [Comamonas nitrativorans]|uniref:Cyclic diguanosine monophosphate-binding protein n=1 Tax=Comamonas nitrativorans TaxID=108437 RepID=A0ABV9GQZ8_9BURK|nr:PilZ domain-containing protein [Comamonas sp.]
MPQERRQFQRLHFDTHAQFVCAGQAHSVQLLDISLRGALIEAPGAITWPREAPCQLIITLGQDCHIAMAAEVAHVQGGQIGLRCRNIDLDSITHLRRLLELQLGDPALLERDLSQLCAL